MLRYSRAVLKISGEVLSGPDAPLDDAAVRAAAEKIARAAEAGAQLGVVVGGGNILRGGRTALGVGRVTADHMGMLATVVNAMALAGALNAMGRRSIVQSALPASGGVEPYATGRCVQLLGEGAVVFVAGGTGNPYFSTDTAAALRAAEIGADVLLKATKVDGVYSADPVLDPAAVRFDRLTYDEAIAKELGVMDMAAFSLCRENAIPIIVFAMDAAENVVRALRGEPVGTLVERNGG